jgi:hypothetical protein
MTDVREQIFALLDSTVDSPFPEPPIDEVVRAGQRRRAQRRVLAVGAIAITTAAVVLGITGIMTATTPSGHPVPTAMPVSGPHAIQLAHGQWIHIRKPPIELCNPSITTADDRLIVLELGNKPCPRAAAIYDASTNQWRVITAPPQAIGMTTLAAWTGRSLVTVNAFGVTMRWTQVTDNWQQLGSVPDAKPFVVPPHPPYARGVSDLVWTGRQILANVTNEKVARTYGLGTSGQWSQVAELPEPRHGVIFDAPMAVDAGSVYALAATSVIHDNPDDYFISGSVQLLRLDGDTWIPEQTTRSGLPKSQLTMTAVRGGIVVTGAACPGQQACTEEVGRAAFLVPGQKTDGLMPPHGGPYPYDMTAGGTAVVVTYPAGRESYGAIVDRGPKPGSTSIYDLTTSRWITGPRAPHGVAELFAHWTSAGVVDLGVHGEGWLLRPSHS